MKVVQINATCGADSAGKICVAISEHLSNRGIENYIFYTEGNCDYPLGIKYADDKYMKLQAIQSGVLGNRGFTSRSATKKLIGELEKIDPDIIHLHRLHRHNCNLTMLFDYIKAKNKKVYWTFHDCWAFTANCQQLTMVQCEKWKTECHDCPQIWQTSWLFDRSHELYGRKKKLFSGVEMTIITPSQRMADLVKQSFLKAYPVKVIHNGIDLQPKQSDFLTDCCEMNASCNEYVRLLDAE